ncbi:DoxX family protein [Flavobacterium alkalisoli]|uniref:DoxX family protein n=1 Tax=Flavobacterium alkalisoli TaxID=2602769 RepID=A0A5B9FWZ5_9FLAO|nr:DoxX family protein [Flavobacterium alkalisoli]QEE50819.1 DoxX family protein [Flavobacterium alkalisoli]
MKVIQLHSHIESSVNDLALLAFRVAVSAQLIVVHGLKKLGIGVTQAENVPNPLHLPQAINQVFATSSNVIFPLFIIFGVLTRLATLPILAVTLTGYFIVHGNDPLLERDVPFMYSIVFLLILILGPGKYSIDNILHRKQFE